KLSELDGLKPYYELNVKSRNGGISDAEVSFLGGPGYRLPKIAEWNHACLGGTSSTFYFGNDTNVMDEYVWFNKTSGGRTHPVGEKKPNGFGLHDIVGNVGEWNEDLIINPMTGKSEAVLRGGGFNAQSYECQNDRMYKAALNWGTRGCGIRLARDAIGEKK
ncbi:MAG: formylglycine-generating enzyme family protein, partial [Planctomycetes bacterium]|nr:formylglycine-generating enzyme family protein [Planctomycetota bacterium]